MNDFTRRNFLKASTGFGYLAFAGLAALEARASQSPLSRKEPHFPARAKRVIFFCMRGGPSHLDTFDYKPQLQRDHRRPSKYGATPLQAPFWKFNQHGQGGLWISELFPNLAQHADELCLLNGMHCDQPAHTQAVVQMHTGYFQGVRPSMGAWALYGLGSENEDLPGFITVNPPSNLGGAQNYGSAFLPAAYQGTRFKIQDSSQRNRRIDRMRRGEVNPYGINNVVNNRYTRAQQEKQVDLINALNRAKLRRDEHAPLVEGAIQSYELGFRMQAAVPQVMNLDSEPESVKSLYGIGGDPTDGFGRQCLLARRLAESGVRFIELGHGSWDQHANITTAMANNAAQSDKPIAGLIADLKARDMLKDTLLVWGGEFGRTPYSDNGHGRDHNHKGYTSWMAGGGVKGGVTYGRTDDLGYEAVQGKVHIHDWHATILHLLGLDHEKLTFRHASREMRLTDVGGDPVTEILA